MKKQLLLITGLFVMISAAIAQPQPTGALTIFSEDGDKFFLILNGERQNTAAQTNLRVEDLTQQYYNAKVIFEDNTLGEISKNYLPIVDANGTFSDVTYKIKKDKNNGKMSLKYFSQVPMVQGYVPPANVYVMHYGAPAAPPTTTVVTTTTPTTEVTHTTTTTTTSGMPGNNVGANVNVGGLNMNVNITDPNMNGNMQTTTTTTHTTTTTVSGNPGEMEEHHEHHEHHDYPEHNEHVGCPGSYPMAGGDFSSAISTIKGQSFEENKLSTAKQIATNNCLSTGQIVEVCQTFSFEESKLDFAKFAYDHCTEPKNYFKINNVFSFSSSTDELNKYLQGRQ